MSSAEYAALVRAVQDSLSKAAATDHGRNGKHATGGCPSCKIIVCLSHHHCTRSAA